MKDIREAAGLSQAALAAELTTMAETYGLDELYDDSKVSRIEAGLRGLSLEEGALVVLIDPEGRGVVWLAFGGPVAKAMRRGKAR
ncbi:MAG TPA: helix-turn-helix domain-containing protein [Gemmatimonadaceae bacterium]|nr:helix-turn-helix domain-containing protein [Gemmatimonadaceae bacterium]